MIMTITISQDTMMELERVMEHIRERKRMEISKDTAIRELIAMYHRSPAMKKEWR